MKTMKRDQGIEHAQACFDLDPAPVAEVAQLIEAAPEAEPEPPPVQQNGQRDDIRPSAPGVLLRELDRVDDPDLRSRFEVLIQAAWVRSSGHKITAVIEQAWRSPGCPDDAARIAAVADGLGIPHDLAAE